MTTAERGPHCGFVIAEADDGRVTCGARPAPYLDGEDGTALCDRHALAVSDRGRRVGRREPQS